MGYVHTALGVQARVVRKLGRSAGLTCNDVQQWLANLGRVLLKKLQLELFAIGQHQQADQAFAALCNVVEVEAYERLAAVDLCAVFYQQLKAFALQLKGVDTQVHQQFSAVFGTQRQGMSGFGDMHHHPVTGGKQTVVQRVDTNAIAHHGTGKYVVRYVGQLDDRTAKRRAEGELFIIVHGAILIKSVERDCLVSTGHFA